MIKIYLSINKILHLRSIFLKIIKLYQYLLFGKMYTSLKSIIEPAFTTTTSQDLSLDNKLIGVCKK